MALATQIAVNISSESFEITQAFVKTNTEDQSSSIEIVAEYEGEYLSPEERRKYSSSCRFYRAENRQ